MLLINKAIITENNILVAVGSFSHGESAELKGLIIFQKDSSTYNLMIEDIKIIYDVIEYKPNIILTLTSDDNKNCRIQIFDISAATYPIGNDIDHKSGDYLSATLNIRRCISIFPVFSEEYRFAKIADDSIILYYNLQNPNCKTRSIVITLKEDLVYQSVAVVDKIIHSDNVINEYRPNQIQYFNLIDITPLKNRIRLSTDTTLTDPDDETILILRFISQYAELSSHDMVSVDHNDTLADYQVCHNKIIIICRNEFEGELISKIYVQEYRVNQNDRTLSKVSSLQKLELTIDD